MPVQERSLNCKFLSLKLLLVLIVCGTFLALLLSPAVYSVDHLSKAVFISLSPSSCSLNRWMWERPIADPRYVSHMDVNCNQISKTIEGLVDKNGVRGIGLLNFNDSEIDHWKQLIPWGEHVVNLAYVEKNVTWEILCPEWIDEEEESEVPICLSLPEPKIPRRPRFDLIAVKLPCCWSENWLRDVA